MKRFGRYALLRRLGAGGMGEVFLARSDDSKLVVIKRVLPHLAADSDFRTLFLDEARTLARLTHPNIVRIFELGEEEGQPFLVMEYVHGVDLLTLAQQRLPVEVSGRLIADAAGALDYAHKACDQSGRPLHVVHRDVSPHNLLIGVDGVLKLIDFGIARAQQGGKVAWMSPELVLEGRADARSDQFSLGVIFWELLAGRPLFDRPTDVETIEAVTATEVPPLPADVPEPIDTIVRTMLARDAGQRFAYLSVVRDALLRELPSPVDLASLVRPLVTTDPEAGPPVRRASAAKPVSNLEPHEAEALEQLRLMGADFTLEAAEQALDLKAFPKAPWALDVVQSLVEKGHVSRRQREDGSLVFTAR